MAAKRQKEVKSFFNFQLRSKTGSKKRSKVRSKKEVNSTPRFTSQTKVNKNSTLQTLSLAHFLLTTKVL